MSTLKNFQKITLAKKKNVYETKVKKESFGTKLDRKLSQSPRRTNWFCSDAAPEQQGQQDANRNPTTARPREDYSKHPSTFVEWICSQVPGHRTGCLWQRKIAVTRGANCRCPTRHPCIPWGADFNKQCRVVGCNTLKEFFGDDFVTQIFAGYGKACLAGINFLRGCIHNRPLDFDDLVKSY